MEARLKDLWAEARELSLGSSGEVDRLESAPRPLRFLRDYVSANKPCIVSRSATAHWPAVSLWADDAYLLSALGRSADVSVHVTPHGRADSVVTLGRRQFFASGCVRTMPFSDALELITDSSDPTAAVAYAQQQDDSFREEYSAVAGDVESHIPWATEALGRRPEAVNLWIGDARSHTSFHKDHYENLYAVITGEKHFLLLPPTDVHRLYIRSYPAAHYTSSSQGIRADELRLELDEPEREVPWCSVDPYPLSSEDFERQRSCFPLYFEGPAPFQCTVKAGEILYLPSMWFHHVRQTPDCNGRTIAINYWYDMQFDIKYAYFNFLQSIDYSPATNSLTSGEVTDDDSESETQKA